MLSVVFLISWNDGHQMIFYLWSMLVTFLEGLVADNPYSDWPAILLILVCLIGMIALFLIVPAWFDLDRADKDLK